MPIVPFFAVGRITINLLLVLTPLEVVLFSLFLPLFGCQFVPPFPALLLMFPADLPEPLGFIDPHLFFPHSVEKIKKVKVGEYKHTVKKVELPSCILLLYTDMCLKMYLVLSRCISLYSALLATSVLSFSLHLFWCSRALALCSSDAIFVEQTLLLLATDGDRKLCRSEEILLFIDFRATKKGFNRARKRP